MFNYIVIILLIIILLNKVNNNIKCNIKQTKKNIKKVNNIIEILPDKSITIQNRNIINNIINRKLVN